MAYLSDISDCLLKEVGQMLFNL